MRKFLPIVLFAASSGAAMATDAPTLRKSMIEPGRGGTYAGFTLGGVQTQFRTGAVQAAFPVPPGVAPNFATDPAGIDLPGSRKSAFSPIGGLFVGHDFGFANGMFAGVEADLSLMRSRRGTSAQRGYNSISSSGCVFLVLNGTQVCTLATVPVAVTEAHSVKVEQNGLVTVRARLGTTFGATSVYVTAGLAAAQITQTITSTALTQSVAPALAVPLVYGNTSTTSKKTRAAIGVAYGLGLEHSLTQAIRLRAEYLRYDLGSARVSYSSGASHKTRIDGHVARLGLVFGF